MDADRSSEVDGTVRQIVADVLGVDLSEVAPGSALERDWDSVQALNIAMSVEQAFGVQLSAEQLGRMTDLPSIVAVLSDRG
jgi:acyl carrier protein